MTKLLISTFSMLIMIAANTAIPNPDISKASPIKLAVSIKVMALMTNKKKPNVIIVTGKVKITRIGFTKKLIIESKTLAKIAAEMLSK